MAMGSTSGQLQLSIPQGMVTHSGTHRPKSGQPELTLKLLLEGPALSVHWGRTRWRPGGVLRMDPSQRTQSRETEKDGASETLSARVQLCLKLPLGLPSLTTPTLPNHLQSLVQSPRAIAPDLKHKLELQAGFRPQPPPPCGTHTPRPILGSQAPRAFVNGAFITVSHPAMV